MNKKLAMLLSISYCLTTSAYFATRGMQAPNDGLDSELPQESLPEIAQVNRQSSLDAIQKKADSLLFKTGNVPTLGRGY